MFPSVDTKSAPAVAAHVARSFSAMYPGIRSPWLDGIFHDVESLFQGRYQGYEAVDLKYHDLEHTLQATVCLTAVLAGRHSAAVEPRLSPRQFELAVASALLHDAGYIKVRGDSEGTGAKYTYCHVLRSCAFTASYLPLLGALDHEIEAVLGAINCTGPSKQVSRLRFREPIDRTIGCALATGDYLGQMAASDYPDELVTLFNEFKESDDFTHVPAEKRTFTSAIELIEQTPAFWHDVVVPKLEHDFQGVYHFLAEPYPNGRNPYVDAVETNLTAIKSIAVTLRAAATAL